MAAGVGRICAALLCLVILMQLKSVLYQELEQSIRHPPGFHWPNLKLRIHCFGKQTLQGLLSNEYKNSKSCNNGKVSCVPLISTLCLLLSSHIHVNPGPCQSPQQTVVGCFKIFNGCAMLFNFPDISE